MAKDRTKARRRGSSWPVALVAVVSGVLGSGALVWRASEAAFTATAANPANSWAAGRVSLTDDDGGTVMFTATGLKPGNTGQKCIKVTYGGTLSSGDVRIHSAAPTGTLGAYINLTVEIGTVGTFASCGAFAASATVVNNVPLSTVGTKTDHSTGYPSGWSPAAGEERVFRFTYTLSTSVPDAQQGATCTMPFTWETRTP